MIPSDLDTVILQIYLINVKSVQWKNLFQERSPANSLDSSPGNSSEELRRKTQSHICQMNKNIQTFFIPFQNQFASLFSSCVFLSSSMVSSLSMNWMKTKTVLLKWYKIGKDRRTVPHLRKVCVFLVFSYISRFPNNKNIIYARHVCKSSFSWFHNFHWQ